MRRRAAANETAAESDESRFDRQREIHRGTSIDRVNSMGPFYGPLQVRTSFGWLSQSDLSPLPPPLPPRCCTVTAAAAAGDAAAAMAAATAAADAVAAGCSARIFERTFLFVAVFWF